MVTACEPFPSDSLSTANTIVSFICSWRSCQSNMCGLFRTFRVIHVGSWVSANCPTFRMASTVPPLRWLSPKWLMDLAALSKPIAYKALANDFETQRSSPSDCTKCTWGASGTCSLGYSCKCDSLKSPTGMSTNPHLIRLTSSKNPVLNCFTKSSSVRMGCASPWKMTSQ